jgi:hypothetical protein
VTPAGTTQPSRATTSIVTPNPNLPCTNTWITKNYKLENTFEYQNTATSPTYKPSLKFASKWNGPWYAPGEYLYVTIMLDDAHCDEGYIVSKLISYVTSYIPWAGSVVSWQFNQTAKEIVSKNQGYGVKIVLKLPIVAVGVPLATNTVTSRPAIPPGPVWNEILGMSVHAWPSNAGSMSEMPWGKNDMGQGPYALSWLVADIDRDGKAEIIQPWKNSDKLGMIVYGWDGRWMAGKWGTDDMGTAPGAYSWLVGDVDGDRKAEIIQPWMNGNELFGFIGMNVYGWENCQMVKQWG